MEFIGTWVSCDVSVSVANRSRRFGECRAFISKGTLSRALNMKRHKVSKRQEPLFQPHNITSHHITSHHITSHHITSHIYHVIPYITYIYIISYHIPHIIYHMHTRAHPRITFMRTLPYSSLNKHRLKPVSLFRKGLECVFILQRSLASSSATHSAVSQQRNWGQGFSSSFL